MTESGPGPAAIPPATDEGMLQLPSGALYVRAWGASDAPPVLAVHPLGWGASGLSVAPVAAALAGDGRRVVVPDLAGFGRSPQAAHADDYRPPAIADRLGEVLDALQAPAADVVGVAWGATIACWLAARHPARVRALALVDGGHVRPEDQDDFERDATLQDRLRAARRHEPAWRSPQQALEEMAERYGDWTPWQDAAWRAALEKRDLRWRPRVRPTVYAAAVHGLATTSVADTWPALAERRELTGLLVAREGQEQRAAFTAAVPAATVRAVDVRRVDLLGSAAPVVAQVVAGWLR